jgi:outer membrane lipoprotein-sorting protein
MFRKLFLILTAAVVMALPVTAQTVDELIAKDIQARGGLEKIKAVKTIRFTGKMSMGQGMEVPGVMEQKRPNSMRMEFTLQGLTAVVAYDGKTGWQIMPFGGKKDPEQMGQDDLKEIIEQADIDGPLVDYKEKGNQVELVGKQSVEGTDAYKLKVTLKSGTVQYIYLDADSYLPIKEEGKRNIRGTEMEYETTFGDYKEVGGLMFAHSNESGVKGSPQKEKLTFEKIEINPPLDDSRFQMPEVKKPEPKPEEKKPL